MTRPPEPMASMTATDGFAASLADLMCHDPSSIPDAVLQALQTSVATGNPTTDQTRHIILRLLAQRRAQIGVAPTADPAPLPAWPTTPPTPLPPFHPSGLVGTSLVAACHDDAEALLAALPSWLATSADEIILIDWSEVPQLAQAITASQTSDPRLRLVTLTGPDLSPAQAYNTGFRLARHQRIVALAAAVTLAHDSLTTAPTSGEFRIDPGPVNGSGFVLDINRRDLAHAGGFNEHLDSADFLADELMARLTAQALRAAPAPLPAGRPLIAPVLLAAASLRHALQHSPEFAALRNRFIAAVMPDWTPSRTRPFQLADHTDRALTLHPAAPPTLKPPMLVRADAEHHAMIDLVTRHIGGAPVTLNARRLEIILNRPADDVCALDIAIAGGPAADLVKSRRAWLVADLASAALPLSGDSARTAFKSLETLALDHGMTLVLRLPADAPPDEAALLSDHPLIPSDADLTQGFRPLNLRDLQAADTTLPHGTFAFTAETVADFARLAATGPSIFLRRPKLFIDAQHGLGNRLRAIASAGAMAWATDRELVIIWQADAHCGCQFDDLFLPNGAILTQGFHTEAAAMGIALYNYMDVEPGSALGRPVILGALGDVYLRSAYPLVSPQSSWAKQNAWLRTLEANNVVMELVASVRNPSAVSVHIRMEGGSNAEHLPYESPLNWGEAAHRDIDHWRKRSHFSYFQTRLDQLVAEGQADTVFLASDTQAVYDAFTARYGNRIARLPRNTSDRSAPAMVHALADAILLSRAPRLLGSTWSSFTELADRLARQPIEVELSGRDF